MGRRKKQPEGFDLPEPASAGTAQDTAFLKDPVELKPRLSVALTGDGFFDLSSTRGDTKDRLKKALQDPNLFVNVGLQEVKPVVSICTPAMVQGIYGILGSLEASLAARFAHVSLADGKAIFIYTQNEIELLSEPTSLVIDKHASDWLRRYKEEVALALTLVWVHQVKLQSLAKVKAQRELEEREKAQEKPAQRVNGEDQEEVSSA